MRYVAAGCAAAFAAAFAGLAAAVIADAGPLPGDRRILLELHDIVGTSWDEPLTRLADLTDLLPLAIVAGLIALALAWVRRWWDLAYAAAVVGVVWVANPVLKELFERPRPDLWPHPMAVSEHSFPSGHAANTTALAAALVMVAWGLSRARWPAAAIGAAFIAVVGFGQLALGVHYPSDVLAGWLWAGAWAAFVWWVRGGPSDRAREPSGRPPPRGSRHWSRS